MASRLEGKVAIVTGAGAGMGEATAILFAREGAKVVASDIDETAGADTVDRIARDGGTATFVPADVSREDDVQAAVEAAVRAFGRLDCAVNNAAVAPDDHPIAEARVEDFDRIVGVNLKSVLLCMKHEIGQLLRQGGGGSIVNIASINGVRPQPDSAIYTASKHGVIGLTRSGSLEYAPRGIRVNAVCPGAIDTPMIQRRMAAKERKLEDFAPMLSLFGRFGRPEEVAEANLWLCSDASSYVTGHTLAVDGGYLGR